MVQRKSTNEYESGLYLDLYSFYLPRYGKICDFMLGQVHWVRCRESAIKPRKNKDIQGKTKICKIKLKCSWFATAVYNKMAEMQ